MESLTRCEDLGQMCMAFLMMETFEMLCDVLCSFVAVSGSCNVLFNK